MIPRTCKAEDESCPYASDAAEEAVRKVFAIMGVNIKEPKEVEEFRKDLRFGGEMRRIANHGILAIIAVVAAGIAAAVWAGITNKIVGH